MNKKVLKILVKWFEVMPDGNIVLQTRVYNKDEDKAYDFVNRLPERGITKCTINTMVEVTF